MSAEIKPGSGQEREVLAKVVPLNTPFTLNIVTSTVCNFKCTYCVHSVTNDEKEKLGFQHNLMNWNTFTKIADQIKEFSEPLKAIFLYGVGEPLCNPKLADMVRYLKNVDVRPNVGFITNGALLNKKNILDLVDAGIDTIRISIQGMTEEKYYETCGIKINYEEFLDNIKFLYENKKQCNVYVKIIDIALSEGEEKLFYDTFRDISDRMFIEKCMPIFEGVDYSKMIIEKRLADRYGNIHNGRAVCPQTFYTLSVMPDGEVRPCDNLKSAIYLGNINDTTLKKIWHGKELKEFWKMQLDKKRFTNNVCSKCCAPDDVSQKNDELDDYTQQILLKLND